MGDNISLADVLALSKSDGLSGGNGMIFLLFILILFGGGRFNGYGGNQTTNEVEAGFRQNTVINKLDGLSQGLCTSTYEVTNNMNRGFNSLEREISNCCCETNRNIDSVRYDMSKGFCDIINANAMNTRDIIDNQNTNTQRLLDTINQNTIQDLRDKLNSANNILAQDSQSRYILGELGRYVTNPPCPPHFAHFNC